MGIKLWISPELDLKPVFPTDSYLIQLALNTPELVLNTPDKTLEEVDTRSKILKHINRVPGIRYRELLRLTGLPNGTLEYHLKILESIHKVTTFRRCGRRTGYYPIDVPADESHVLEHIRNQVARQIVFFILEHDLCTFGEVVEHTKKAQSTVSWHLKRLSEAGIISISFGPENQLYSAINDNLVKKVLYKYKETFRDKIANAYYEIFEEL